MTGEEFALLFGEAGAFELRFDVAGRAAVRVAGGPVAPRHVEPAPPPGPWVAEARCGAATGWLLAPDPPADAGRAQRLLDAAVAQRAAQTLQEREAATRAALAQLLERLTHRLRTDVTTLQAVADGLISQLFGPDDLNELPGELARTAKEALQRISEARDVMSVLAPDSRREPEPIAETLRAELEGAGREDVTVSAPTGEHPLTIVPGAGWSACARLLAADPQLTAFTVEPDPLGWRVSSGPQGAPIPFTRDALGDLVLVGAIAIAAGGRAHAERDDLGTLRVGVSLPAAPPSG